MKKFLVMAVTCFLSCTFLGGCGGGGKSRLIETGSIEGYVYVPESGKGQIALTRQAGPPLGYIPLYGATVRAEIGGKIYETKTDNFGHFKLTNLPIGMAKVTISPPLLEGTTAAEFLTFTTTIEVKANTTAYVGPAGQVSLISNSADHLQVLINQIDTTNFPNILVYLSIIDPIRNSPIIGVGQDNLEVYINGRPSSVAQLKQVSSSHSPASICLVLDRSGSMAGISDDNQPLKDLQKAAKEFISYLGDDDRAEIISFSYEPAVDCLFTNDKVALNNAVDLLEAEGGTALYDAIYKGIESLISEANPRKAVIALTDGGENSSTEASLDSVINLARRANIPVYTIGLQGFDFTREAKDRTVNKTRSEQELQQIARETNGEYFYAPQSSDLMGIYTKITQRQQQQYIATILDTEPEISGRREIELLAKACGLEGKAVSEYEHYNYDYPIPKTLYNPGSYNGRRFYYDGVHLGEDIKLPEGTPIRAIGNGKIVQYESHSGYGELCAVIEHDLNKEVRFDLFEGHRKQVNARYFCSIYGHIRPMQWRGSSKLQWKVGDTVKQGEVIGYINDGAHNGDGGVHLHMGIRLTQHPGYWAYYGYSKPNQYPESNVKYFAAFSEVIKKLR